MKGVVVTGEVAASAIDVFAILSDVRQCQVLAGRHMDLVEISQDAQGRMLWEIDLNSRLGIRRRIATREVARQPPWLIWGVAASSSGSVALVSWSLSDTLNQRTRVSLAMSPVTFGLIDRALFLVAGRRVLSGIMRDTLRGAEALLPWLEPAGKNASLDAGNSYQPAG